MFAEITAEIDQLTSWYSAQPDFIKLMMWTVGLGAVVALLMQFGIVGFGNGGGGDGGFDCGGGDGE
jgi:hypothetical protein